MGPFEVKVKRSKEKRWALVLMDVVSNATYCDIVADYSTAAVMMTLTRFGSLYGWPTTISSDPGSQLVSAGGKLESWWLKMEKDLKNFAGQHDFNWVTSPGNAPWRQGKTENKIGKLKRLLRVTHSDTVMSPEALQTALFRVADLANKVPITLQRRPDSDGTFDIIRPCDLLQGRASGRVPEMDGTGLRDSLIQRNLKDVAERTRQFYKTYATLASPRLMWRKKWQVDPEVEIQPGDVVRVLEATKFKNKFKLAKVESLDVSHDGKRRTVNLEYTTSGEGGKMTKRKMVRAVQKLALVAKASELSLGESSTVREKQDDFFIKAVKENGVF